MLRESAEGASQRTEYTLSEIESAIGIAAPKTLDEAGIPALKEMIVSDLERNVLDTLRKQ